VAVRRRAAPPREQHVLPKEQTTVAVSQTPQLHVYVGHLKSELTL
jgi:hypothetical protein